MKRKTLREFSDMELGAPPMANQDDHEAAMARADLYKLANYSFKLFKMINDGDQLEGWVQAKITKAADYVASVFHFMEYQMKFSDYGRQLENSDMYSESIQAAYAQKLTEARQKLDKLRNANKKSLESDSDDVMPSKRSKKSDTEVDEAKKPSAGMSKEAKSKVVKQARAGKDIGKPGKMFGKIEAAAKKSGARNPTAVAAAAMWKNQAKKAGAR